MRGFVDRVFLIGAALVIGGVLLGWMFVADRLLGLGREQHFFVGGTLVYNVGTFYFLKQHPRRRSNRLMKALAIIVVESPVVLFFILFSLGVVPWPRSMLPYVAGSVLISPVVIVTVDRLFQGSPD